MTREEAIYRLKNMAWLYGSAEREQNLEAIDMAIESLQSVDTIDFYTDGGVKYFTVTAPVKQGRKKIYIAGPVTGVEGYEGTFAKAADDLRAKGYEPVNPVAPGLVEGWTYRDYINRGFQMLMECDGMLLLPGYMDSKGAALELHYALAVGMEIIKG